MQIDVIEKNRTIRIIDPDQTTVDKLLFSSLSELIPNDSLDLISAVDATSNIVDTTVDTLDKVLQEIEELSSASAEKLPSSLLEIFANHAHVTDAQKEASLRAYLQNVASHLNSQRASDVLPSFLEFLLAKTSNSPGFSVTAPAMLDAFNAYRVANGKSKTHYNILAGIVDVLAQVDPGLGISRTWKKANGYDGVNTHYTGRKFKE